jgi:predicted MPP superfamily phosphohydrolase
MIITAIVLWLLVAVVILALMYGALFEARRIRTERIRVALPRLPEALAGFRIVHIGDTHCRTGRFYEGLYRQMVAAVNEADADLVLISGDLAAGSDHIPVAARWLGALRARLGVLAVPGNHDLNITMERWLLGLTQGFDVEEIRRSLADVGVTLLHNESKVIEANGQRIVVLGIGDASTGLDDLENTVTSMPSGDLIIILTHSPDLLDVAGVEVADLVLCGHTHGGQMMLPGIGPVWSPVWRGRLRGEGLLAAGDVAVHVTRGVGTSWPVRLGCPPQVAVLELQRAPIRGRPVTPMLKRPLESQPARTTTSGAADDAEASAGGDN